MAFNLKGRNFLTLKDFTKEEISYLIDLAAHLKSSKAAGIFPKNLKNKNIALIFEKPSTRTRCAFVVACVDEGAHPEYLGKGDIQLGKKESVADTAKVLGRMFDGIQFRGYKHETVEILGANAGVPVWNGLTEKFHPTQILADLLTVQENFGTLEGISFTYVGDGRNNMANSLLIGCAKMGMDFRIYAPAELFPSEDVIETGKEIAKISGASITITDDAEEALTDADVIYTDVWASMGEEDQIPNRIKLLKPFKITEELMAKTQNPDTIFLHCLPSFHDMETEVAKKYPDLREVDDKVFSGLQSKVFDQAENRLHTIKAVMVATI